MTLDINTTIIVVTYNRINYFKTFIKHLYRSTKISFKLIVVDNGSKDGTREYVEELEKCNLVSGHIFTDSNLKLAQAFSEGFKLVDTKYVITVADDMFVSPELNHDWLEIFIKKMDSDENIGCINFKAARCEYNKFVKMYG